MKEQIGDYELLRDRLAEAMRSAHSSGDTVSSPIDAADYALAFLLTDEGWLMLEAAYAAADQFGRNDPS